MIILTTSEVFKESLQVYKHIISYPAMPGHTDKMFAGCPDFCSINYNHEPFSVILHRNGADWREAIFVDNDNDNVLAARREGVTSIQFKNTRQLKAALRRQGFRFE